jgi:hypothetical protein
VSAFLKRKGMWFGSCGGGCMDARHESKVSLYHWYHMLEVNKSMNLTGVWAAAWSSVSSVAGSGVGI